MAFNTLTCHHNCSYLNRCTTWHLNDSLHLHLHLLGCWGATDDSLATIEHCALYIQQTCYLVNLLNVSCFSRNLKSSISQQSLVSKTATHCQTCFLCSHTKNLQSNPSDFIAIFQSETGFLLYQRLLQVSPVHDFT